MNFQVIIEAKSIFICQLYANYSKNILLLFMIKDVGLLRAGKKKNGNMGGHFE